VKPVTLEIDKTFVVEGIVVPSHPEEVRIVLDRLVLDVSAADVVLPRELRERAGSSPNAGPVRLEIRRGARLLGLESADDDDSELRARRGQLFAARTRAAEATVTISDRYRRLERAFLARYGLQLKESRT